MASLVVISYTVKYEITDHFCSNNFRGEKHE